PVERHRLRRLVVHHRPPDAVAHAHHLDDRLDDGALLDRLGRLGAPHPVDAQPLLVPGQIGGARPRLLGRQRDVYRSGEFGHLGSATSVLDQGCCGVGLPWSPWSGCGGVGLPCCACPSVTYLRAASCTLSTCSAYLPWVRWSTKSPAFSMAASALSGFFPSQSFTLSRKPISFSLLSTAGHCRGRRTPDTNGPVQPGTAGRPPLLPQPPGLSQHSALYPHGGRDHRGRDAPH